MNPNHHAPTHSGWPSTILVVSGSSMSVYTFKKAPPIRKNEIHEDFFVSFHNQNQKFLKTRFWLYIKFSTYFVFISRRKRLFPLFMIYFILDIYLYLDELLKKIYMLTHEKSQRRSQHCKREPNTQVHRRMGGWKVFVDIGRSEGVVGCASCSHKKLTHNKQKNVHDLRWSKSE